MRIREFRVHAVGHVHDALRREQERRVSRNEIEIHEDEGRG